MNNKLIELLENDGVEIIFNNLIPYLCYGTTFDYGVVKQILIGDHNITGYNSNNIENVSQETMNNIKQAIINVLKNESWVK